PSPLSKISSCPQGSRQGFVDRVSVYGVIMSISSTQPLSGSEEWPHQCASQPIVSGHHHLAEHRFEPSDPPTSPPVARAERHQDPCAGSDEGACRSWQPRPSRSVARWLSQRVSLLGLLPGGAKRLACCGLQWCGCRRDSMTWGHPGTRQIA